jgi:hypothetical protein
MMCARRFATMLATAFPLLLVIPHEGAAKPCECKDIQAMTAELDRVTTAEAAWMEIFAWARGLHRDIAEPSSNDELNTKYAQLARAPRSEWDRIMHEPIRKIEKLAKAGELNEQGEPVVNPDFAQVNCDDIVEGVRIHETAHRTFFLSPGNFLEGATMTSRHLRLRSESEVVSYRAQKEFIKEKLDALKNRCKRVSFKGVTVDCVMAAGTGRVRTGQKLEGYVCGDPTRETWTINPVYFVEAPHMPPIPPSANKPFSNDCVPKGSEIERRRAEVYLRGPAGAGGWMCVYEAGPPARVTIRNFRPSVCSGPKEQSVTVEAVLSDRCDTPPPSPPNPPPRARRPVS